MRVLFLTLFSVVMASLGCGGGNTGDRDTAPAKYKAQYEALRAKLKQVAALIPPAAVVKDSPRRELNPAPFYKKNADKNYELIHLENLLDPEERVQKSIGLGFTNYLLNGIRWTGPKAEDFIGGSRFLEDGFKKGLETRYLVVMRTKRYVPITDTGRVEGKVRIYVGGEVDMDAFLVDLAGPELVGSFTASTRASEGARVDRADDEMRNRISDEVRKALARISNAAIE